MTTKSKIMVIATLLVIAALTTGNRMAAGGSRPPSWLVSLAHRTAASNGDPHPSRIDFVAEGHAYVVTLRGHFVCTMCSRPYGAPAPRGTVVTIRVDSATRGITDFSIGDR